MKTTRVEKHIIHQSHAYYSMLDSYCFKSKNLYNHATYLIRKELTSNGKWLRYEDLDRLLKVPGCDFDYRSMPSAVSAQQTLRSVDDVWKAYFQAHKDWKRHPHKYLGEPKFPKYKHKSKGRHMIRLTNQSCSLDLTRNVIKFPKVFNGFEVKCQFTQKDDYVKFLQTRIVPKGNHIVIELVYEIEVSDTLSDSNRCLGIDLGVDNLAAVSNNVGLPFYLIDGKSIKSINRYWNKLNSKDQSILTKSKKKQYTSARTARRNYKRTQKINDYLHKASRWIVNFAKDNNIDTIVIGKNDLWKQKASMGKCNNQKFVQIPHARFINMMQYKGEECGIKVICIDESYTSKTSFLDNEVPAKQEKYAGNRIERGLFKTSNGTLINADSNAALQILKKYNDNLLTDFDYTRILLQRPIKLNVS